MIVLRLWQWYYPQTRSRHENLALLYVDNGQVFTIGVNIIFLTCKLVAMIVISTIQLFFSCNRWWHGSTCQRRDSKPACNPSEGEMSLLDVDLNFEALTDIAFYTSSTLSGCSQLLRQGVHCRSIHRDLSESEISETMLFHNCPISLLLCHSSAGNCTPLSANCL